MKDLLCITDLDGLDIFIEGVCIVTHTFDSTEELLDAIKEAAPVYMEREYGKKYKYANLYWNDLLTLNPQTLIRLIPQIQAIEWPSVERMIAVDNEEAVYTRP